MTGNAYTGTNGASSSGILLIGGGIYGPITTGVSITNNTLINNDVGVYVYNTDASGSNPPSTKTKNSVVNNTISNDRPRTSPATALRTATRSGSGLRQQGQHRQQQDQRHRLHPDQRAAGSIYTKFDLLGSTKPHFNNNG